MNSRYCNHLWTSDVEVIDHSEYGELVLLDAVLDFAQVTELILTLTSEAIESQSVAFGH
jgi:hypothetical protein